MAYNLRTGLTGSGDIDVNVTLGDLNAANITSGIFDTGRIPTIGDSKLSDLNAAKLTGLVSADRIGNGTIPKLKISNTLDETWAVTEIPVLPKAQIDPYHNEQWHVDDLPTLGNAKISDLSATKLTGTIASERLSLVTTDIPTLPKTKVSTHAVDGETWPIDDIPSLPATKITSGQFDVARIPNLSAGKITADTLNVDRIPDLSADKITSDTLAVGRIPNLDASKITTGTISSARLPATVGDCLMLKAVGARYGGSPNQKTIGTSLSLLDSHLAGSFVAPPSAIVSVSLRFFVDSGYGSNQWLAAQLIKGGTTTEFVEAYSLDDDDCKGTRHTYVVRRGQNDNDDEQIEVTWVLDQLTVGSTYAIDVQVIASENRTCFFGSSNANNTNYPPIVFRVDAAPANSGVHIYAAGGF